MIAHLPLPLLSVAAGPLLAVGVWVVLRRGRRPVQVYVGLDEAASKTARVLRVRMRFIGKEPARIIETEDDCRGSAVLTRGRSTKKTPAPRVDSMGTAALPLHFHLLRRLGVECRLHERSVK